MRQEFRGEFVKGIADPLNKWPKENHLAIIDWCGFLPMWFANYATAHKEAPAIVPVKDWMTESYGMGELHEMRQSNGEPGEGSGINEDGTHTYPGDPDLHPFLTMEAENGAQLIQWCSGIVAFRDKKENPWFLTRMD